MIEYNAENKTYKLEKRKNYLEIILDSEETIISKIKIEHYNKEFLIWVYYKNLNDDSVKNVFKSALPKQFHQKKKAGSWRLPKLNVQDEYSYLYANNRDYVLSFFQKIQQIDPLPLSLIKKIMNHSEFDLTQIVFFDPMQERLKQNDHKGALDLAIEANKENHPELLDLLADHYKNQDPFNFENYYELICNFPPDHINFKTRNLELLDILMDAKPDNEEEYYYLLELKFRASFHAGEMILAQRFYDQLGGGNGDKIDYDLSKDLDILIQEAQRIAEKPIKKECISSFAPEENDIEKSKLQLINILNTYQAKREQEQETQGTNKGNVKQYLHFTGIHFFERFQKSYDQKSSAVSNLKKALYNHDKDIQNDLHILRNGNLGKQLREFVKNGNVDSFFTKKVNTISDFIACLADETTHKPNF